jgi:hypothetical protein
VLSPCEDLEVLHLQTPYRYLSEVLEVDTVQVVDEDLGRLQHLIDGGRFDDSPTKWKAKKESKA